VTIPRTGTVATFQFCDCPSTIQYVNALLNSTATATVGCSLNSPRTTENSKIAIIVHSWIVIRNTPNSQYYSAGCSFGFFAPRGAPTRSRRSDSENAPPITITTVPSQISSTSGL
jgi:hypothetical protein